MIYVIYAFGGFFVALCVAMLYVFYRDRHFGIFLMGVTYGTSGLLAISLPHWWPIVVGFVMVWMLKLMGLEQGAESTGVPELKSTDTKDTKDSF